jgi:hypothetical protein
MVRGMRGLCFYTDLLREVRSPSYENPGFYFELANELCYRTRTPVRKSTGCHSKQD